MKMTYTIVAEMTAGGSGGGRFLRRHQDADGKVVYFQSYEEAVKRCEELNAAKVDRNLRYSVERRLTHYFGIPFRRSKKILARIEKIVWGDQIPADRAALEWAIETAFRTAVRAPKGGWLRVPLLARNR